MDAHLPLGVHCSSPGEGLPLLHGLLGEHRLLDVHLAIPGHQTHPVASQHAGDGSTHLDLMFGLGKQAQRTEVRDAGIKGGLEVRLQAHRSHLQVWEGGDTDDQSARQVQAGNAMRVVKVAGEGHESGHALKCGTRRVPLPRHLHLRGVSGRIAASKKRAPRMLRALRGFSLSWRAIGFSAGPPAG